MINLIVKTTVKLRGAVLPPSSKSLSIRAMLFSLLAQGESILSHVLDSDDALAARNVCTALGASVNTNPIQMIIKSNGLPFVNTVSEINTGNSGITTLFTLPLLGLRENGDIPIVLDCGDQMRTRPIKPLVDALSALGMKIDYLQEKNQCPVSITGKLKGGNTEIEGFNSQYLSALLIALPSAENDSVITVNKLHERPYVNMTLDFLTQQKIAFTHQSIENKDVFHIKGNQRYQPLHQSIPGDFSSASCLIAAAALIDSNITLQGLNFNDQQGDKRLVTLLQSMGAEIIIEKEQIKIKTKNALKGIRIDANDIPDLVPALAVIGTQAMGKTEIVNVKHARIKETDRLYSMTEGLRKMGANIEVHDDGLTVYQSNLKGALVEGFNDHRTVMALSIAGMIASGTTTITNAEAINKTYPEFIKDMQSLGAQYTFESLPQSKHIILLGFKHVGKTAIGKQLAKMLEKKFIDVDNEIEKNYEKKYFTHLTCRQIMQAQGEAYFRELEAETLKQVLQLPEAVISLGGGTAFPEPNQLLIKHHILLHIMAPSGIVFERIMVEGQPAFFEEKEDPYESFSRLWDERNAIYKKLTSYTVNNNTTVDNAVDEAIEQLQKQRVKCA